MSLGYTPDVIPVTPPGGETVYLRSPTFAEWHGVVIPHRELAAAGKDPPADLIARTVAVCLCDEKGKALVNAQDKVMRAGHREIMWLYQECWNTVLKSGDAVVTDHEKNSAASRDS